MTRPTARVLQLLELLQSSSSTRTLADLADRLGVDERTVRRYVEHLVELGVPVRSVRGRHGGIVLGCGHRVPPLMLTDEEALVVLLGLLASRRAGLLAASAGVVETAVAKLGRVLPAELAGRLDPLVRTAEQDAPDRPVPAPSTGVVLALARAVRERRPVALRHAAADGRSTRREVRPLGLVARSGHWYLGAADASGGALRVFRLDRVSDPEPLPGTFEPPPGYDATDHVRSALAAVPWRHEVRVRVGCSAERVEALFPPGLSPTVEPVDEPGWVRVGLRAERLDWVPALLAGLPVPFVVEAPEALRDLVRALADRLAAAAVALTAVEPVDGAGRPVDRRVRP